MMASSSRDSTVDLDAFGPVGRSAVRRPVLPLGDRLLVDPVALGQHPQALLTILYCSTDRLCRGGAPMKNLAHSASFESELKGAPSKPGIKHLDHGPSVRSFSERMSSLCLWQACRTTS